MSIIIHDVPGGSDLWHSVRAGKITATDAVMIVTARRLDASTQDRKVYARVVAEWRSGGPLYDEDWGGNYWTDRGRQLEPEAREEFALSTGLTVRNGGFIERGLLGCSPDGLIYSDGVGLVPINQHPKYSQPTEPYIVSGLELKCPSEPKFILISDEHHLLDEYRLQVQWSMWVLGVDHWYWMAYHPAHPAVLHRVERDQDVIDAFEAHVPPLVDRIERRKARALADGVVPIEPGVLPDPEAPPGLEGAYQ